MIKRIEPQVSWTSKRSIATHLRKYEFSFAIMCAIFFSTSIARADCIFKSYGPEQKQSVAEMLKTEYGSAYTDFNLDFPISVGINALDETGKPTEPSRIALGFRAAGEQHGFNRGTFIVVTFDRCSGQIVDSQQFPPSFFSEVVALGKYIYR